MTHTELRVVEMYLEDGMRETEIAAAEGIPVDRVHEILAAYGH